MFKKIKEFIIGLIIIFLIYYFSFFIVKITKIAFPPAILGLILFTFFLSLGLIKESWIKRTCDIFLANMSLLFVPFVVGLAAYREILAKNWIFILITITLSTALVIIVVGLVCEWGIKFFKIRKIKNKRDKSC